MENRRRKELPVRLTARDCEILESLARKVRAFSVSQVARGWWKESRNPTAFAHRRLSQLANAGYVRTLIVHVSPLLDLGEPLYVWCEGRPVPDFGSLAWRLQSRWPETAPQPTEVIVAAPAANNQFGGPVSRPRFTSHHATHDLHVSELFLRFRETRSEDVAGWLGEDIRPKSGYRLKDPDVLIETGSGRRPLVIEFGGRSYEATHLRAFHEDCAARGRNYELW
jgi:hypothetical protein